MSTNVALALCPTHTPCHRAILTLRPASQLPAIVQSAFMQGHKSKYIYVK